MMRSAASGAADFPPSADRRDGRRRARTPSPGQTPSEPASRPSGSRSSSTTASSRGPDGEQARLVRVRGAAAVRGAETASPGTDALWETEESIERPPPSEARRSLRLPCVRRDASPERPGGGVRGRVNESEASAGGEDAGCGQALWGGGCCLQSELRRFHINKRVRRSGEMQREASAETQSGSGAQAASESVTQQNEALQDEIERLEEENEDLKVWLRFFVYLENL